MTKLCNFAKGLVGDIDIPNQAVCTEDVAEILYQFARWLGEDVDIPNQAVCTEDVADKFV